MKKIIICIGLSSFITLTNAQIVPSSCNAPNSIKALYRLDSKIIAAERMSLQNNLYQDSVNISPLIQDSIMGALAAVHNALTLPASDSVANMYNIHIDSSYVATGILVKEDS